MDDHNQKYPTSCKPRNCHTTIVPSFVGPIKIHEREAMIKKHFTPFH